MTRCTLLWFQKVVLNIFLKKSDKNSMFGILMVYRTINLLYWTECRDIFYPYFEESPIGPQVSL